MTLRFCLGVAYTALFLWGTAAWAAPGTAPNADKEDAFLDWASQKPQVAEMSVQAPGVVWVVLKPEAYKSGDAVTKLARELACGYDRIVKAKGSTVTIWPETGTAGAFAAKEQCK